MYPLDFVWEYIKGRVYGTKPATVSEPRTHKYPMKRFLMFVIPLLQQSLDQTRTVISLQTGIDKTITHFCRSFSILKMRCMLINTDFMII